MSTCLGAALERSGREPERPHHDHHVGEWIGIRPQVDPMVTFARQ
jgi:hypothetical protein